MLPRVRRDNASVNVIPSLDFETLLDAERSRVLRFLRRLAKCDADADDALQECYARAWRSRSSFDAERGGFGPWLMRIAFRSYLDLAQRAQRGPEFVDAAILEGQSETRALELDEREELEHCLAELSKVERHILLSFHRDGRSIAEISAATGIKAGTVKSHLHRARQRLRTRRFQTEDEA